MRGGCPPKIKRRGKKKTMDIVSIYPGWEEEKRKQEPEGANEKKPRGNSLRAGRHKEHLEPEFEKKGGEEDNCHKLL